MKNKYHNIISAMEKISGTGWDIHTYSKNPKEVMKKHKKDVDHKRLVESTGRKSLKGPTNYKLNMNLSRLDDDLLGYTHDKAYGERYNILDKKKAKEALERYRSAAERYKKEEMPERSRTVTKVVPTKPKTKNILGGVALGGAAGAGAGYGLSKIVPKKYRKGAKMLPSLLGISGGYFGGRVGSGKTKPVKRVKKTTVDPNNRERRKEIKGQLDNTIQQWEKALNDPKVKSIGLEFE